MGVYFLVLLVSVFFTIANASKWSFVSVPFGHGYSDCTKNFYNRVAHLEYSYYPSHWVYPSNRKRKDQIGNHF